MNYLEIQKNRVKRAQVIAQAGGLEEVLIAGGLPLRLDVTLSEAIVLGLLRQGVKKYIGVLGHGSTEIGEVLRVYEEAGLVQMYSVRSEIEAAHAALALRWVKEEKAAVVTSIGPGALQALAASLAAASDGIGVWFLFGDETTEEEGPNMQQIQKYEQHLFLRLGQTMGQAYCLDTPESVGTALRRGLHAVDHPYRGEPFYLLLPMNTQAQLLREFNLDELPVTTTPRMGAAEGEDAYGKTARI